MNMQGRNSHCQGHEVGEVGAFVNRKESPLWLWLWGRGGEETDRRMSEAQSGWEADVLRKKHNRS